MKIFNTKEKFVGDLFKCNEGEKTTWEDIGCGFATAHWAVWILIIILILSIISSSYSLFF